MPAGHEAGGGTEDEALQELKAKMGLLEAPKDGGAKQLGAGVPGKTDDKAGKGVVPYLPLDQIARQKSATQ